MDVTVELGCDSVSQVDSAIEGHRHQQSRSQPTFTLVDYYSDSDGDNDMDSTCCISAIFNGNTEQSGGMERTNIKEEALTDELLVTVKNEQIADAVNLDVGLNFEMDNDAHDTGAGHPVFELKSRYEKVYWRQCDKSLAMTRLQKVQVKEKAVSDGLRFLQDLHSSLKASQLSTGQRWLKRIDTIKTERKVCQIMVGFLGTTGAGKSSLINALLHHENLLPSDDGKACTAVCVKIVYNRDDDPAMAFRTRIEFIGTEDWRNELEGLAKDIADDKQNKDGEDGEIDVERTGRIKIALSKVKCVYPNIKTKEDVEKCSINELMENSLVKSCLGRKKDFGCSEKEEFSSKIQPYVNSNKAGGRKAPQAALWPLVKIVRLDVKSDILKQGICLVDLPGSHDTNAARGKIAADFQRNLAVNCVVAPSNRAESDKPAQDLLGDIRQRTMALDNRFSSDKLCFVITKCDDSITVSRYINTYPPLRRELLVELDQEKQVLKMLDIAINAQDERLRQVVELGNEKYDIRRAIEDVKAKFKAAQNIPQKRKADDDETLDQHEIEKQAIKHEGRKLTSDLKNIESQILVADADLSRIQRKVLELNEWLLGCESRKMAACIIHRSEAATAAIREDFESATQMMQNITKQKGVKASPPLQVFSVSSKAFVALSKGPVPGFPTQYSAGIRTLREWLVNKTLRTRRVNAELVLEKIIDLQVAMGSWISSKMTGPRISQIQKAKMDKIFEKSMNDLKQKTEKFCLEAKKKCEILVEHGLFKRLPYAETQASQKAEAIVRHWSDKPMHWSTHRCCNRMLGQWKSYKGVELQWNEELAGPYFNAFLHNWTSTIYTELPASQGSLEKKFTESLGCFTKTIVSKSLKQSGPLNKELLSWQESTLRTLKPLSVDLKGRYDNMQECAKDTHRLVAPKIKDAWIDVFAECGRDNGTGHYKRNQGRHIGHVQKINRTMYEQCSQVIRDEFCKHFESLNSDLYAHFANIFDQSMEQFELLLDSHYDDNAHLNIVSKKKQLQDEAAQQWKKLEKQWSQAMTFEETLAPEIVPKEAVLPTIDDMLQVRVEENFDFDFD